jgi:hypothetical protein
VGLVRLARTRQTRGAVEKYYVAVARLFSADPELFASRRGPEAAAAAGTIATRMLDLTAADLRALLARGESPQDLQEQGILSYLEVTGTRREIEAIRTRLNEVIEACARREGKKARRGEAAYRLTIAFFPLPPRPPATE